MSAKRYASLGAGLAVLVLTAVWLRSYTAGHPMHQYGFTWFRQATPGEVGFALRYLFGGSAAAALLVYAGMPWMRRVANSGNPPTGRRTVWILTGLAVIMTALVAYGVLHDTVVTDDEYVYQFQAGLLAQGRAAAEPPQAPDFFINAFVVIKDGRWFGQYPPGHPLVLAPFAALGAPRLAVLFLVAANVWLSVCLFRHLFGAGWSVVGGVLLLTSPLFLLTSATLLSHGTAYLGLVTGALGTLLLHRGTGNRAAVLAGTGLGLLFVTRPYTGATLGGVLGIALLIVLVRRRSLGAWLAAGAALLFWAGLFLTYNQQTTGDPFTTGYQAIRNPGQVELGFGTIIEGFDPHTPARGIRNSAIHALRLHTWAFGWPLMSAVILLGFFGERSRFARAASRSSRRDSPRTPPDDTAAVRWSGSLIVTGLASYILYWSIGVNDTGPVKLFELMLPVTALTVAGLRRASQRGRHGAVGWALASLVVGLVVFWPGRIQHLTEISRSVRAPYEAVAATVRPPAVVFTENVQPRTAKSWVYGRPNPNPDFSDPIIYVRDLGPQNRELTVHHPSRKPYRLRYEGTRAVVEPMSPERP